MNVIEHYFNKLSTHSRNKLLFLYLDTKGEKFPSLFSGFVFHDNRSLLIKFYLNVLNFLVNDMIRISVFLLLANLWNINLLFRIQKKQLTKISVLMPFLWKKFWVQGRVILWVIRNLELFDITANTVSICMILIWLKSKNITAKYNWFKHFQIICL